MRKGPAPLFLLFFSVLLGVGSVIHFGLNQASSRGNSLGNASERWQTVRSDFEEWIPLSGRLEASHPVTFRSELDGLSKLIFLAEDGTPVEEGEVIARFDHSDLEERKRTLTRDLNIAKAHVRSLREAEHPLELRRIEQEIVALENEIQQEDLLLSETKALVEEDLLAPEELQAFDQNLSALRSRKDALEHQLDVTRRILHPAAIEIATARKVAAEAGLQDVLDDLNSTVVRASADGSVHLPLIPIDGERRPARVGDGLYRNQVYLELANLTDLVIRAEVGERLLAKVVPGMEALVTFPAFPDNTQRATITSVGAYPRGNQRRYPVELFVQDPPPELRPGLTAVLRVLSSRQEDVIVVPREFVQWQGTDPYVLTENGRQEVEPGAGNAGGLVVTSGLSPGTWLLKP